jgi:transposase
VGVLVTTYFISYNSADAEMAVAVATALRNAGETVRFDKEEVPLGMNVSIWITEALDASDRMVAIVSPDYLKPGAKYSLVERSAMLWSDIDGKKAALVPFVIRDCVLPKILAPLARYNLATGSLEDFITKLVKGPSGGPQPIGGSNRRPPFSIGVPTGRPVIGREDEVLRIAEMLRGGADHKVMLVNSGAVLAGQGGIGKTTLARHFAETRGGDYPGVLWTGAATRQDAIMGLCAACAHLGLPVPDQPQVQHAQAVVTKIAASTRPWLIVFDNVEDRKDIDGLVPAGAHVIVTTRQGAGWDGWQALRAEVLAFDTPDAPAVRLLMEAAGRTDGADDARALAEVLGGLPLALVVMGAYLREQALGFADGARQLRAVLRIAPQNAGYPSSVLGAVELSYRHLSDDAKIVAQLCSFWAAEGLGPRLICDAPDGEKWPDIVYLIPHNLQALAQDEGRVRKAFSDLGARSILAGTGDARAMHRMTAAALRELEGNALAPAAVALLAATYPYKAFRSKNFPVCVRLTPHVRAFIDHGAAPDVLAWSYLASQASVYLSTIADYTERLKLAQEGLRVRLSLGLPDAHCDIAVARANLGVAHQDLGHWEQAEFQITKALNSHAEYRPGSDDHAGALFLLGRLLLDPAFEGQPHRLEDAVGMLQLSAAIQCCLSGRRSEPVAQALEQLGIARGLQGRGWAAARLVSASLKIKRHVLPPGDELLADPLILNAFKFLDWRRPDLAEPLLGEALERVAAFPIQDSQEGRVVIPSFYGRCWGSLMGRPLPMELRQRVVDFVEEGHTHRAAAAQFRVSIKFVNDMVLLKRATGSLEAKPQGSGGGHGKLAGVAGWIEQRIKEKRDLTLDELVVELRDGHGVDVHRVSVWRRLRGLGLTHKKRPARGRAEAA